ncbi:MAG: pyruvate dehydrogenase (acetyl-transferring) E1 component subunit alpha [Gammaproteobacteria bacterium]
MQGSEFNIETIETLDPEGRLQRPLPGALRERDQLIKLYQIMVLTRVFDRAAINLQRTGAMGTYPSNEGQEAIGTGIGFAMREDDVFVPYYRDVATQIQRGVLIEEILVFWGGDERGQNYQHQSQDFPACIPIATQSCHAVGIAFAIKYRGQDRAVVTTCGDGATSKGDFYESINVAGAMGLPVVFVVNNNQWAISVPLAKQTAAQTIAQKAFAVGIEGIRVDGNDPIAVFEVVSEALERARRDCQPTLVEALSYRLCDHTTADDASRYRDQQEYDEARALEPLIRFKLLLQNEYQWSEADDKALYDDSDQRVKKAIEVYQATSDQAPGEFFDYMFAKPTTPLERQKKAWLDEAKRHA